MDNFYPVLCGGAFLTLLLRARKQRMTARDLLRGKTDILRDHHVFLDLINIVKSFDEPENGFEKITNEYKSCKKQSPEHLSFFYDIIVPDINKSITSKGLESLVDTATFINKYLDIDPKGGVYEQLVRRLLDLIEKDQSIDGEENFRTLPNSLPSKKNELNGSHDKLLDICLPVFLLSTWHFILVNRRDTTIGKETYESWHLPQPRGSKAKRVYSSKIGENYNRSLNISIELPADYSNKTETGLVSQCELTVDELIENELPVVIPKKTIPTGSYVERRFVMDKDSYTKTEDDSYSEIKAIMDGQVSQATKDSMRNTVDDKILPELREKLREPMLHIYDFIMNQADGWDEDASSNLKNFKHYIDFEILNGPASHMMRLSEHRIYDSLLNLKEFAEGHSRNKLLLSVFGSIRCEPSYYTQLLKEFESLVMEIFGEDDDA